MTVITGPVPAAHGNIVESTSSNRSINDLGPFVRLDAQAIQPLWTWGQLDAARDAAEAGYAARKHLVDDTLGQVQVRVVQLFWAEALAKRLLVVAKNVDESLHQAEDKIQESLDKNEGTITTEDRYRVRLFRAQLEQRRADAEKALELAHLGLAATFAVTPEQLQIKDVTIEAQPGGLPTRDALLAKARVQRPDLLAVDEAIHVREAQAKAAFAAQLPQIFLAGQFTFAYAPNRDIQTNPWILDPFRQVSGGVVLGFRQNLAIPLLRAQVQQAEAELGSLRRQREGLERLVEAQVEAALTEATAARTRLVSAQGALAAGKGWFRSAALNFGLGVDDARSLLEAYAGYVESQLGAASAAYDLLVAQARMDQLTGEPLAHGESTCVLP